MDSWEPWQTNELSRYEAVHQVWLVFCAFFRLISHTSLEFQAHNCVFCSSLFSPLPHWVPANTGEGNVLFSHTQFKLIQHLEKHPEHFEWGAKIITLKTCTYMGFSRRSPWRPWNKSEHRQHLGLVWFTTYNIGTKSVQFVNTSGSIPTWNNK